MADREERHPPRELNFLTGVTVMPMPGDPDRVLLVDLSRFALTPMTFSSAYEDDVFTVTAETTLHHRPTKKR